MNELVRPPGGGGGGGGMNRRERSDRTLVS